MAEWTAVDAWSPATWRPVVDCAARVWRQGHRSFCDAYEPSRTGLRSEDNALKWNDECLAIAAYVASGSKLEKLWKHRIRIAKIVLWNGSWREAVQAAMQISHYGGTGFAAKELLLDVFELALDARNVFYSAGPRRGASQRSSSRLLYGPCVEKLAEMDEWCPVGPGARRVRRLDAGF